MKSYDFTNKEVVINGNTFTAHYLTNPKQHSKVKGIVWHSYCYDDDGWNQYVHRRSEIYILLKKHKKWKLFYKGLNNSCPIGTDGLYKMLFNLEDKDVREKIALENEINNIKEEISELQKQLEEANSKYKKLIHNDIQIRSKKTRR